MVKKMKKYLIRYIECYEEFYEVYADNPEEAQEKLEDDIYAGKVNPPETCYDSGCDSIKEITE